MAMNGTMTEATFEILLRPPTTTIRVAAPTTIPTTHIGIPAIVCIADAMELPWVRFPIPKDATTAKDANAIASPLPNLFHLSP